MELATGKPGQAPGVLDGGGELGALMRATNWAATPIGPVAGWPQSLRTAVGLLLDSQYPMYIAWGPEFIQLYNDAYRPILGSKKHPAALGQSTRECFREIWDLIGPMFERVLAGGPATYLEDQLLPLDRNGYVEECYFTFCYSAIRDESAGVGGVFVTCTETTGRVVGERRLKVLRDLAACATEVATPQGVCTAAAEVLEGDPGDLPFALLYLREGEELVLAASAGLRGLTDEAWRSAAVDPAAWPAAAVLETGREQRVSPLPAALEGFPLGPWPEQSAEAVVLPIAGQDGPAGVLVAGVSARRALDRDYRDFLGLVAGQIAAALANARAHEEARQRAEALAELDRAKTVFFSNVSHEFRTPLTLMLGPLEELLASRELAPAERAAAAAAHRNALRQLRLVNTLLDFSRVEAGRIHGSFEPVDLAARTAELASSFRSAIEQAGLELELATLPLSVPVYVDPDMWEKIVLNLLSNAFKHTFEGRIAVSLSEAGGAAELAVRDTGVGIPEEELPRIFDRFHRVAGARARSQEGTGIGLALVRELVWQHGGEIAIESRVDEGTTVTVRVPLGSAHLPPERIGTRQVPAPGGLGASPFVEEALRWLPDLPASGTADEHGHLPAPAAVPAHPARILIADDNRDLRDYLARLLRPYWTVSSAPDGSSALAAARRSPPDLVLADVMMPGLDGFELLRALREDPATREVPVVLLSARAGEEARVEGLGAGADDYIVKPFGARELVARIAARLELSRLRRQAAAEREGLIDELSRERGRLAEIFEQAPAFIAVLRGPDHVFERVNHKYEEVAGRRPLVGRTVREAFAEIEGIGYFELLDEVFRSGRPYVGEELPIVLRTESGELEEKYLNFVYQPLHAADGSVEGIFVHGIDVSELVRARKAAEEASRAKSDFMATMSHELRTPLNAVLGYVDLLRMGVPDSLPPGSAQHVERIAASARHLLQLIEELLEFTRLQSGTVDPPELTAVALAELTGEVEAVIEPLARQKGITFAMHASTQLAEVHSDPRKLRQILLNLLGNAVKFTERGAVRLEIAPDGDSVLFTVTDTGIGMRPEALARVFEPFWQADQSRTRASGGTGLGLAISKRLAELIGGDIAVDSQPGNGSRFTLRLPRAAAAIEVS